MHEDPATHDIRITGFGSYLPAVMHDHTTLPALDDPIAPAELDRIGVDRRGWASERETIAEMAAIPHSGTAGIQAAAALYTVGEVTPGEAAT